MISTKQHHYPNILIELDHAKHQGKIGKDGKNDLLSAACMAIVRNVINTLGKTALKMNTGLENGRVQITHSGKSIRLSVDNENYTIDITTKDNKIISLYLHRHGIKRITLTELKEYILQ